MNLTRPRIGLGAGIVVVLIANLAVMSVRLDDKDAKKSGHAAVAFGREYVDSAGRFSDHFGSAPNLVDEPADFGTVHAEYHLAASHNPTVVVEEGVVSQPVFEGAAVTTELRAAFSGFASSSGLTAGSQSVTTYRGYTAVDGDFTGTAGQDVELIAFVYDPTRFYFIAADKAVFPAVTADFQIIDGPPNSSDPTLSNT